MILNESVLMLADKSGVIKILNKLILDDAFHYFAHSTSKRNWTIIVRVTRVAFLENGGDE
jgi:hypothetical protein